MNSSPFSSKKKRKKNTNFFGVPLQLGVSFYDGSPLPHYRLVEGQMDLATEVIMKSGSRHNIDLHAGISQSGIWPLKIDLREKLG